MKLITIFITLCMLTFTSVASSQEFFDSDEVEAQKLLDSALVLQKKAQHKAALPLLERAFKLHKRPDIAIVLASTEEALGRYVSATQHLTFARSVLRTDTKESKVAAAALNRVRRFVTEVRWEVYPPESKVYLDGKLIDHTKDMFVRSGKHQVVAKFDGRESLHPDHTLRPSRMERIKVVVPDPIPGFHDHNDDKRTQAWPWIAGVGTTLTLVAIVTGAVLTVQANDHADRADELLAALPPIGHGRGACAGANRVRCAAILDERKAQDPARNAATGMWVTAGLLGVGTTLGAVLAAQLEEADKGPSSSIKVSPVVGASRCGVQLTGRW